MQKTIFVLFTIYIFLFSTGYSQVNTCKKSHCLKGDVGYVNFTIGTSIPTGSFSNDDINNSNSGFAIVGSRIGLNGGYNLTERVNLCAGLIYSVNGFDYSSLTQKLRNDYPGTEWTTTGRSWDIYGFMIGASYSYPFRNKFTGNVKFQTGFINSSIPEMIITSNTGLKITEAEKSATSIAYQISVGGFYPLGRLIDAMGSLEYLSSSPTFNNINRVSNLPSSPPGSITGTGITSYNHNVNLLSINFGFRVKF